MDHPRSRGVYTRKIFPVESIAGSSPLARGLRSGVHYAGCGRGIIPARAGFTGLTRNWLDAAEDHPRSRGVYYKEKGARKWVTGSSPLARGLRYLVNGHSCKKRIIPARAGFTAELNGKIIDH